MLNISEAPADAPSPVLVALEKGSKGSARPASSVPSPGGPGNHGYGKDEGSRQDQGRHGEEDPMFSPSPFPCSSSFISTNMYVFMRHSAGGPFPFHPGPGKGHLGRVHHAGKPADRRKKIVDFW
jgi:hypothetical protein